MKLSPKEVQARYKNRQLKIALIGMSNIGKSHLATRLTEQFDFSSIEVDAVIQSHLGKSNMNDHASWLGQPYSEDYAARERDAIALETRATSDAVDQCLEGGNVVLDAPGSVIYVDNSVLKRVKTEFWNLYIEASKSDIERLKQLYFTHPKPLIWNNTYNPSLAENPDDAVIASYDSLLDQRAEIYNRMADFTVPAQKLFSNEFDLARTLGLTDAIHTA